MDQQTTRSLGAILAIDIVGYSRQMGRDEETTLRRLQAYRDLINEIVVRHGGRVFGVAGDSEMAVLPGAVEALECALAIQDAISECNATLPAERRMPVRIGINFGKVLIEGEGVYGDEVNIAARAEALAGKGGICVTGAVFDRVNGKLPLGYEDYGPQRFKNIDRRIRTLRVRREPLMIGRVVPGKPPIPRSRWRAVAAAALVAVAGASVWGFYLQDQVVEWRDTAVEQAAAATAARERAQALLASLEAAETRISAERQRAAELLAGLLVAERTAAARVRSAEAATKAEAERAAALLASLQDSEMRASAEQARAEGLLAALRETEAQAAAARDAAARRKLAEHVAEREHTAALLASWEATERQAAAERQRVKAIIAALADAEDRATVQARAADARASVRAETERQAQEAREKVEELVATLMAAERKASEELRKGEALMASLEETGGVPKRERVQALLAALQEAGQTAAAERKRAELLLASWETPEAEVLGEDVDAAQKAAEARAAERERAETLFATWQDAEATAAKARARAEVLFDALRQAEAQARDHADQVAPETEALTPTRPNPEDGASAPTLRKQLAALPGQPEGTDALLSQLGGGATTPAGGEASLEAVERLLRERREDFETVLDSYLMYKWADPEFSLTRIPGGNRHFRFWDFKVMGRRSDGYDVRVIFESRTPAPWGMGAQRLIVSLRLEGDDFQIVGHRSLSADDGREAAVDQAPATPEQVAAMEAVERLLRRRQEDLRERLHAYLKASKVYFERWRWNYNDSPRVRLIREMQLLGRRKDRYALRVLAFISGRPAYGKSVYGENIVLLLKIEGDDFEIVGHEFPSDEGRGQAARALATPEQLAAMDSVERLLQEREEAFRRVLQAYLARNQTENFGGRVRGRISRLWQTEVLGAEDDTYRIRVLYYTQDGQYERFGDIVVFLKIDGGDFEIVGHEFLSAAAQ